LKRRADGGFPNPLGHFVGDFSAFEAMFSIATGCHPSGSWGTLARLATRIDLMQVAGESGKLGQSICFTFVL
jgi:hypothetical protein